MRTLALLLSVYILILSAQPCDECWNILEERSASAPNIVANEQVHDECAPFCVFSCCNAGLAETRRNADREPDIPEHRPTPTISGYTSRYSHSHTDNIWQPPKT